MAKHRHRYLKEKNPPSLAMAILYVSLPARIREQLVGDLVEEFGNDKLQKYGALKARLWFWRQSVRSSCLYLWKGKGDVMALFLSLVIFFGVSLVTGYASGGVEQFVNLASLTIVLVPAIVLGMGATSFQALKDSIKLAFTDQANIHTETANQAALFFRVTARHCLWMGIYGVVFGWIGMLLFMNEPTDFQIARSLGVSLLTLLYGIGFQAVFYTAEQRLIGKYMAS